MEHTKGKVEVKQIEDLSIFELGFRVSTPDLLREIANNGLDIRMGMLKIPINELRRHLILLAELAIKIDNPELHIMMLRLGLYEDSNSDIENKIKQLQKEIKETKKANTNESGLTPSQLYKQNQDLMNIIYKAHHLCDKLKMPTESELNLLKVICEQAINNAKKK